MIILTTSQKVKIRRHWANYKLRFCKDGRVMAQKTKNGAWGVLYTPEQLINHIGVENGNSNN